jgi:hypothetical protein
MKLITKKLALVSLPPCKLARPLCCCLRMSGSINRSYGMSSNGITCLLIFVEIGCMVQKLKCRVGHRHRQHCNQFFFLVLFFRRVCKIVKGDYPIRHICLSVLLSAWKPRLPLGRFSWNLVFEHFSKICRGNSSSTKIWQKITGNLR